jgi:hypothetical protein
MTDKKRKLNTIELTIEKPAPKRAKTHSLSSEPLPRRVSDTSSHSQNYRNKPHKIPSQNSTFGVKQKGKAIDLEKIISDLAKYFDEKWSTSSNHEQQHIQREDERFHETLRRCLQKVRSSCLGTTRSMKLKFFGLLMQVDEMIERTHLTFFLFC